MIQDAAIRYGQPFGEYLDLPGEHFSGLKKLDISPRHYRLASKPDTAAMRIGRALHALVLTPEVAGVALYDGPRRQGKAWEAFAAKHSGDVILTAPEHERVIGMRAAVACHEHAAALLAQGDGEVTVEWQIDGVACKSRLDWLDPGYGIVEVKTTRRIDRRAFMREFAQRAYHVQLALQNWGVSVAMPTRPEPSVHVIVVENEPPHDVCVYRVEEPVLEVGALRIRAWLDILRECRSTGNWPGVDGGKVLSLELPDWALTADLQAVDMSGLEEVA